jgi:hypothetical protein
VCVCVCARALLLSLFSSSTFSEIVLPRWPNPLILFPVCFFLLVLLSKWQNRTRRSSLFHLQILFQYGTWKYCFASLPSKPQYWMSFYLQTSASSISSRYCYCLEEGTLFLLGRKRRCISLCPIDVLLVLPSAWCTWRTFPSHCHQ